MNVVGQHRLFLDVNATALSRFSHGDDYMEDIGAVNRRLPTPRVPSDVNVQTVGLVRTRYLPQAADPGAVPRGQTRT